MKRPEWINIAPSHRVKPTYVGPKRPSPRMLADWISTEIPRGWVLWDYLDIFRGVSHGVYQNRKSLI